MLDKSLPYFDIVMKMRADVLASLPEPVLPEGYSFRFFRPGDEYAWARLESQVLEFPTHGKALEYYRYRYLGDPLAEMLSRRCVFVVDAADNPVATATAWYGNCSMGNCNWFQWIATDPGQQGKGLGRAVITRALKCYLDDGAAGNVYLHTQTWSHKAIYLYHKVGFQIFHISHITLQYTESPGFRRMNNSPEEGLKTLETVYPPELLQSLRDNAEYPEAHELADGTPWLTA